MSAYAIKNMRNVRMTIAFSIYYKAMENITRELQTIFILIFIIIIVGLQF